MMRLLDLPTEVLRLTLSHLLDIDIRTFLVSRSTCKTLEANIKDILEIDFLDHGLAFHALLASHFHALFDSSAVGPIRYLIPRDNLAPLRTLPWTSNTDIRKKWERQEASWRRLPLASPTGAIVRGLQMVSVQRHRDDIAGVYGNDVMFPIWTLSNDESLTSEEHMLPGGACYIPPYGVTIGWLYDFIIGADAFVGEGWKLHFETKISDPAEFAERSRLVGSGEKEGPEDEIMEIFMELFVVDKGCAVLVERGGWCPAGRAVVGEEIWHPQCLDEDNPLQVPF
ncbi:hypothetical protein BKA63DRAFT_591187 [Paraphoma chrysanthemicola]|nr:hypothetical protein BKA63DRAFT_591187 [Paraphoma chrysanthemicola]